MRIFATCVKYPAWAELVPSVALLTNRQVGSTRLDRFGGAQSCFSLTLLQKPCFFDPLSDVEGPAQHLNVLVSALRDRSIPFDFQALDIDRPWRDTAHTTFLRRATDLELVDHLPFGREPPLEWAPEVHGVAANVLAAVLMDPSDERFGGDFEMVEGLIPQVAAADVPIVLVAAGRSRRTDTAIHRLAAAGLPIHDAAYECAIAAIQTLGDGSSAAVWALQQSRSKSLCLGLMGKLGVRRNRTHCIPRSWRGTSD